MLDHNIMNWDDAITTDGTEFVLLDEGDYDFTVTKFERGQWTGSAKIPQCPMAVVTLSVSGENGVANIRYQLQLYRTLEWKLSAFFRALGLKKHGEELRMDWSKVEGATGRAHIIQRKYTTGDGQERVTNDVSRFYDKAEEAASAMPAAAAAWGNRGF